MKLVCLVLCLNIAIPSMDPRLPPSIAERNSAFSGILQLPLRAFSLSTPISRNAKIFNTAR